MTELSERLLPIEMGTSDASLAINLIFKLLANLHALGKLDDEELTTVATSLIAELNSDHDRFVVWQLLDDMTPDYERPKDEDRQEKPRD